MKARVFTESISVDPSSWTQAIAPFDASALLVVNDSPAAVKVRGDDTQGFITLLSGSERQFGGATTKSELGHRFIRGRRAVELQSLSGTGPIHLIWS